MRTSGSVVPARSRWFANVASPCCTASSEVALNGAAVEMAAVGSTVGGRVAAHPSSRTLAPRHRTWLRMRWLLGLVDDVPANIPAYAGNSIRGSSHGHGPGRRWEAAAQWMAPGVPCCAPWRRRERDVWLFRFSPPRKPASPTERVDATHGAPVRAHGPGTRLEFPLGKRGEFHACHPVDSGGGVSARLLYSNGEHLARTRGAGAERARPIRPLHPVRADAARAGDSPAAVDARLDRAAVARGELRAHLRRDHVEAQQRAEHRGDLRARSFQGAGGEVRGGDAPARRSGLLPPEEELEGGAARGAGARWGPPPQLPRRVARRGPAHGRLLL